LEEEVSVIFAVTNGLADKIPVNKMADWQVALMRYLSTSNSNLLKDIADKKQLTKDTEQGLRDAISTFNSTWQA
jgi:F-type H+-transporting ATPase subunit alpha